MILEEEYKKWETFLDEQVDFLLKTSSKHTKEHCKRVLRYSLLIADKKNISIKGKEILCTCSVFHDSRRKDDGVDVGHGKRAAEYYKQFCKEKGKPFEKLAYQIMAYHDQEDEKGLLDIGEERGNRLYQVFKDADALDRFRLGPNGLDIRYLRNEEAKELVSFAKALCEEEMK